MFDDPEWASKEEWDAYAWFGFAISKAQMLEGELQIIATALEMRERGVAKGSSGWIQLRDANGNLTLGWLLAKVESYGFLPADLVEDLRRVTSRRNDLAHEFFWRKDLTAQEPSIGVFQQELMAAASLFSTMAARLERSVWKALEQLNVDRSTAVTAAQLAVGEGEHGE